MQGRLSSLDKSSVPITSYATSKEAVAGEISSDQEGDRSRLRERHRTRRLSVEEDDQASIHEGSTDTRSKRHRSHLRLWPNVRKKTRMKMLDLPTTDESLEAPSKIFASRDRSRKKQPVLPMSLRPVEEINARWKALENKAEGNPHSEDAEKLSSTPYNSDTFLPYSHPLMNFTELQFQSFQLWPPNAKIPSRVFATDPLLHHLLFPFLLNSI